MEAIARRSRKKAKDVEIWGLVLLAFGVLGLLPYVTTGGYVGEGLHAGADAAFGSIAPLVLAGIMILGFMLILRRRLGRKRVLVGTLQLLLLWLPGVVDALGGGGQSFRLAGAGGASGAAVDWALRQGFGGAGRYVILIIWPMITLIVLNRPFVADLFRRGGAAFGGMAGVFWESIQDFIYEPEKPVPALTEDMVSSFEPQASSVMEQDLPDERPEAPAPAGPAGDDGDPGPPPPLTEFRPAGQPIGLPPLDLLTEGARAKRSPGTGAARARLLEETLASFGVKVKVKNTVSGPAVTRFEVQPAPGVKVSRVVNLADDIALAMAATDVRIEAPIPGKSAIGIEVPNAETVPVVLRDILSSPAFQNAPSPLAVGLGKDISGRVVVAALDRMPHLLVAGATGSGKSVCLNTIILSLLFRNTPDQVRLILIDPKVVELKHFEEIPHLLVPVVTHAKMAAGVLKNVVRHMEERYTLFAQAGVRDLDHYNAAADQPLPRLVVMIDELSDLMMVAPVDVEDAICRLAQMARAAGIHLVVATQRPSVDVITGLIKANIPSRLAFAVSSQVDSRTILDQGGAEKLLGKGDMLFSPLGQAKPVRAQAAYVDEQEVHRVVQFLRGQAQPEYQEALLEAPAAEPEAPQQVDELFPEAVRVVVEARQASASLLQSRLRVGYSRARRLVDAMEERGLVGPANGAKPREVRLSASEYQQMFKAGAEPSAD